MPPGPAGVRVPFFHHVHHLHVSAQAHTRCIRKHLSSINNGYLCIIDKIADNMTENCWCSLADSLRYPYSATTRDRFTHSALLHTQLA